MKTKKLKILFDANPMVNGNKSGVGYYTYNLIQELSNRHKNDIELVGHYFNFLGRKHPKLPTGDNISYRQSRIIPGKALSLTRALGFQLPLELFFKSNGDAVIYTNFVALPSVFKIPRFTAIHDLSYEEVPQYVADKNQKFLHRFVRKSISMSSGIITISTITKNSIIKHYGVSPDKICLTYIPPRLTNEALKAKKPKNILGKYILFVGTIEPRKNISNLLAGYTLLPPQIKNTFSLVLAGGMGWKNEEILTNIKALQDAGEKILLTGYVSDEEKEYLYNNASMFVWPSHYEGFGMPPLEAMLKHIPTAVSDIPVHREVTKDGVAYFNKDQPDSIRNAISEILGNSKYTRALTARGYQVATSYEWGPVVESLVHFIRMNSRDDR